MAFASKILAASALMALLSLGACATQGENVYAGPAVQPYPGAAVYATNGRPVAPPMARLEARDGLLSSPPNTARPGECYAKVVVPGQPIGAPPPQPRAVWVQTPPGPGQVSPTWCLYYEQGAAPAPVAMTPERFGWIRVICDQDATVEKITHVQRRLHDWGVYEGPYHGRFDAATALGVTRFQEQRHIDHGGYLSFQTLQALEAPPPAVARQTYAAATYAAPLYRPAPYPPVYAGPCGQPACAPLAPPPALYQRQIVRQPVIQPVIQQEIIRQPVYVQQPVIVQQPILQPPMMEGCGQPACMLAPQPCGGPVCGAPMGYGAYGPGPGPHPALLSWPGKTSY